jgi:hypothetical protein
MSSEMFDTFSETFRSALDGFQQQYDVDIEKLRTKQQPLADALRFLAETNVEVHQCVSTLPDPGNMAWAVRRLEIARELLGEVLDDLEEEGNPSIQPVWDRKERQLWVGEILCREYRRDAPNQFRILDSFQDRRWPPSFQSPWNDEKRLRDTIDDLNGGLFAASPIGFEVRNMKPAWFRFRPRSDTSQLR